MKEIWKDVKDYEGLYQVSNLGRIKSLSNKLNRIEKILSIDNNGRVFLYKKGEKKVFLIYKLIANLFIPNPNKLSYINHKDGNKNNNCVDNLEWCYTKPNVFSKPIKCIETGKTYNSMREACREYNIQPALLCRVCKKSNYKAGGYHWEYL